MEARGKSPMKATHLYQDFYKGMNVVIKNGHIIDPSQGLDGMRDVIIKDGKIKSVNDPYIAKTSALSDFRTIDAAGLFVLPGLVDMHTHLREPGYEYKETIKTGTNAAVRGGFTSVCPMPNTNPINDNATVTEYIIQKALGEGYCSVYPIGAITKASKGEELAEIGFMRESGCAAFSDDGRPVTNAIMMRRALEYSKTFWVPIINHCEDLNLSDNGVMNEGSLSASIGLRGIPSTSEEVMIARDILLAELTGGRLHIAHVSTAGSVRLIRLAKEWGINITAETCPHYFSITEDAVKGYNTNAKVNPPLRMQKDVEAIIEGLRDGTIDVIATDHAPHHRDEKKQEFDKSPFGISGLETALALSLRLVHEGFLTLPQLVKKMSTTPAKILNIGKGTLKKGSDADITIIDVNREWKVEPEGFASLGKNTPFAGWMLKGMPVVTICKGKIFEQF